MQPISDVASVSAIQRRNGLVNAFVLLPCQIVRTAGKLVYRLLAGNPYQPIFFRMLSVLRC